MVWGQIGGSLTPWRTVTMTITIITTTTSCRRWPRAFALETILVGTGLRKRDAHGKPILLDNDPRRRG